MRAVTLVTTTVRNRRGGGALGCLGSIVVLATLVYAGFKLGPPWLRYQRFRDEMKQDAQFAISLPDSVIRNRLFLRADSLGLPPEAKKLLRIHRTRSPRIITITSEYAEQ